MDAGVERAFPAGALVPKTETGVVGFLKKFPEYNGKDVTIAIFDSGVDPRASGLETLCDGKTVKVIERYDCTGCGDVDTTKKVKEDKGFITGLSGRQLKLLPHMLANNTANGEFRVGLKNLYDLCPSKVRENVLSTAKTKEWDVPHKIAVAEALRKINEFELKNPDAGKLTWDKKLIKEDLDNMLEMLNNYEKFYNDIKTSYDCIVYPSANGWQVVVDTSETGDLEKALHIGEYTKKQEMKNIDDYLSISVNVHDEGNVLEIVGMCSSHGTHVASIASGNHSSTDVDGVAPNAKIVSMTIGDGRLGSMETGTGLVRAMMKVMEMCRDGRRIDVINMSYGEHAHWTNSGRIGELMNEVVNKYGVVWIASAGNHGPALCTVGSPPDISQPSCIGVGAFVSPQMMEAEYAMREKLPANVYTWTSRDPCIDGGQGVSVCAPGGAITSVPQFTMSKSQLMNGTSMAAPHVAGAIALLISGLKQRGIAYSPYSIKRAICATATKLGYVDPFAQGNGLLNVERAYEHLEQHREASENMLRFSIRCGAQSAKGIHIREGVLRKPYEYNINIEPIFMNEKEVAPHIKYSFNVRLTLISSASFVQCGEFLDLCYGTRSMGVKVDPSALPPGVHTAVIRAYDSANVQKGTLFEIPVTVVQPHVINVEESRTFEPLSHGGSFSGSEFQPNTIQREFILVPSKATWAVLRMRSTDPNRDKDVGKFFVHTMQLLPKSSCRMLETMKILSVNNETEATLGFKCQENNILELCIAKYWSSYGSTHLKYSLEFHGIKATNPNAFMMHAARGIHKLELRALVAEELQPQLQLKTAAVVLKPTDSKISPLSATRDVLPEGRQIYQNLFTYTLHLSKAQEISLYAPLFNALLYEAEFEAQLWMLFDSNKAMIACGDAHSHTFYTKLEKGDYTIRLQVRHEKRELLEKIAETNMVALYKLSSALAVDCYDHYNQCVIGGRKFNSSLMKESPKLLYVAPLAAEKLAKANLPPNCAWLTGAFVFAKDEVGKRVDAHEFTYIPLPAEASKKNGSPFNHNKEQQQNGQKSKAPIGTGPGSVPSPSGDMGASDKDAAALIVSPRTAESGSDVDDYMDGMRDFLCSMIAKCELTKAEQLYTEVLAANPQYLPPHLLLIQNLEAAELKPQFPLTFVKSLQTMSASGDTAVVTPTKEEQLDRLRVTLERIVQLANNVIKEVDKDALLAYYGLKCDIRTDAAKIKTNMDKQKSNLLEALSKKGIAMAKLSVLSGGENRLADLDAIFADIVKFIDASDTKVIQYALWHAHAHEHYGRMYKYLQKLYDEKRQRENFEELNLVASSLKYTHLQRAIQRLTVTAYPNSYRLF